MKPGKSGSSEGGPSHGALIIDPRGKIAEQVETFLGKLGEWHLLGVIREWEGAPLEVMGKAPALIIVNLDAGLEEGLETAEKISSIAPRSVLLGVSGRENGQGDEWLIRGLRSGFRDFLKFPLDGEEFGAALSRVERELVGESQPQGKVVTLFSPRGGSGLTTLAVNLGAILAKQLKKKVGLIDLDLETGDISFILDLSPSVTIGDLAEAGLPLDQKLLQEALAPHPSGVELLAAPIAITQAEKVSDDTVSQIIQEMRKRFDFVLINTARNFSSATLNALDSADVILLLTLPHLAALKSAKHTVEIFRTLGYEDRLRLVASRMDPDGVVTGKDVEKTLDQPIFMFLPSDRHVMRATNQGLSLWEFAPRSQITRSILFLAQKLSMTGDKSKKERKKKKISLSSFRALRRGSTPPPVPAV
ncbi:MAG: AAA family ATPase [Nitrospinota bacterium]